MSASSSTDRRRVAWPSTVPRAVVFWLIVAGLVSAALVPLRGHIGDAHVTLAYLLVVLAASGRHGRRVGLVTASACFLAFNYFFVPPYGTLAVGDPLDWLVLLAFLATGAMAAQLLYRAQSEASRAGLRAHEMERLAALSAEAIQAARAEDAAAQIARVIREEMRVQRCELYLHDDATDRLTLVARSASGTADVRTSDDGVERERVERTPAELLLSADARSLLLPLSARGRQVGILVLRSDEVISPDVATQPFPQALAYYAALGLERIRLSAAALRADALREADRLKDAMLATVSHDLRTPLTAIKATAHAIAASGDARAQVIESEADRLNRYVTNLLDLSRLNAGALGVTLELVPADDLIGAVLQQVAPLTSTHDVRVSGTDDDALLVGRMDFVLMLRALANVVENALRYSPDAAPVELRVARAGEWLSFEVADRGAGVRAEDRDRIFEPFERGDTGASADGVGLGLAIARRLMEAQGGELSYAPREGGGSVFTLRVEAVN